MRYLKLLGLLMVLTGCENHITLPLQPHLAAPAPSKTVQGKPVKNKIIIAGGQSNNLGVGMGDEFDSFPGVTIDSKRKGPTYAMAASLASRLGPIQIYQCSIGGSSMEYWSTYGDYYRGCMTYVTSHLGPNDEVIAFTFDQGESEAALPNEYPWAQHFTAMLSDLRTHFPNVPIVYVQLGSNNLDPSTIPNWQYIQDQQSSVLLPRVSMVRSDGLGVVGEHYTQDGYAILGERMAQAFLSMQ